MQWRLTGELEPMSLPQLLFDHLARGLPLSLARLLAQRSLVALMYHAVSDAKLPHVRPIYGYKSTAAFEADLQEIREHFSAVSHDQIRQHREEGTGLPPGAVAITFDDGLRECITEARPLLRRYEMPCTFFVIASAVDNKELMFRNEVALALDAIERLEGSALDDARAALARELGFVAATRADLSAHVMNITHAQWEKARRTCELLGIDVGCYLANERPYLDADEIVELHREGFTIGAHTLTHPELWLLDGFDAVAREIVESCAFVRDLTGQEKVPFAFPFNGLPIDRDRLEALRRDNPFVCLMYDTNNLMQDRAFIVNRVDADIDQGSGLGRSNLQFLMKRAHVLEPLRRIKRRRDLRGQRQ